MERWFRRRETKKKKEKKKKKKLKKEQENDYDDDYNDYGDGDDMYNDYSYDNTDNDDVDGYGWIREKYLGIEEEKEILGIECFEFYDTSIIYPVFSYCLLAILLSQLEMDLKPTLVMEIKNTKQEIFEYYKNLFEDIVMQWTNFSRDYDDEYNRDENQNEEEDMAYGILGYLSCFPDSIIFFSDNIKDIKPITNSLRKTL